MGSYRVPGSSLSAAGRSPCLAERIVRRGEVPHKFGGHANPRVVKSSAEHRRCATQFEVSGAALHAAWAVNARLLPGPGCCQECEVALRCLENGPLETGHRQQSGCPQQVPLLRPPWLAAPCRRPWSRVVHVEVGKRPCKLLQRLLLLLSSGAVPQFELTSRRDRW